MRSKEGRTVKQHLLDDELDTMLKKAETREIKRNIETHQRRSERSFDRSMRYGLNWAGWRRVSRMHIQNFLFCAT